MPGGEMKENMKPTSKTSKSQVTHQYSEGRKTAGKASAAVKSSKVRGVPDFSKIHQQWSTKLEKGKAYTKKPCTQVQEFDLTQPGTIFKKTEPTQMNSVPSKGRSLGSQCNLQAPVQAHFSPNPSSLDTIVKSQGLSTAYTTGRNTIAVTCPSRKMSNARKARATRISAKPSSALHEETDCTEVTHSANCGAQGERSPTPSASQKLKEGQSAVEFCSDQQALQSILDNTGIATKCQRQSTVPLSGAAQRLTIAGDGIPFKTPVGVRHTRLAMSARKSIYYSGRCADAVSPVNVYSAQARRVVSQLALDGTPVDESLLSPSLSRRVAPMEKIQRTESGSNGSTTSYSPFSGPIAFKQKGSIYPKYVYRQDMAATTERLRTPGTQHKAQRVPMTADTSPSAKDSAPPGSVASMSQKACQSVKWKDLLGPRSKPGGEAGQKDRTGAAPLLAERSPEAQEPVARTLDFAAEEADNVAAASELQAAEGDAQSWHELQRQLTKLKQIEELEQQLLADIAREEAGHSPSTAQLVHQDSKYFPVLNATPMLRENLGLQTNPQHSNVGPDGQELPKLALTANRVTPKFAPSRVTPASALSRGTPESTSSRMTPESPSSRVTPESTSSRVTPETTSSRVTPESSPSGVTLESTASEGTPDSPQLQANFFGCLAFASPRNQSERTPQDNTEKSLQETKNKTKFFALTHLGGSPRVELLQEDLSTEVASSKRVHFDLASKSPKADRKASPLQARSPNVKMSPKKLSRSPTHFKQIVQVSRVTREGCSPQHASLLEQKENISLGSMDKFIGDFPIDDWHNSTVEDLNMTLSESLVQFEQLGSRADHLRSQQQPPNSDKIVKQLESIQRKQARLLKLQESLQQQLQQMQGSLSSKKGKRGKLETIPENKHLRDTGAGREDCDDDTETAVSSRKPSKDSPSKASVVKMKSNTKREHASKAIRGRGPENKAPGRNPPASWEIVKVEKAEADNGKQTQAESDDTPQVKKVDFSDDARTTDSNMKTSPALSAFHLHSGAGSALPQQAESEKESERPVEKSPECSTSERSPKTRFSMHATKCLTPTIAVSQSHGSPKPTTAAGLIFSPNMTLAGTGQLVQGFAQKLHCIYTASSVEQLTQSQTQCSGHLLEPGFQKDNRLSLSIDGCTPTASAESSLVEQAQKYHKESAIRPVTGLASPPCGIALPSADQANAHLKHPSPPSLMATPHGTNSSYGCYSSASPCRCRFSVPSTVMAPTDSSLRSIQLAASCLPGSAVINTAQKLYNALLNEEVSLYMCRVHLTRAGSPPNPRCDNPVALLLTQGDEQHFVPIQLPTSPPPPVEGSAFQVFTPW